MKNCLLDTAKERILSLKIQQKKLTKLKKKRNQNIQEMGNNDERFNICEMGTPERKETEKGSEEKFKQ